MSVIFLTRLAAILGGLFGLGILLYKVSFSSPLLIVLAVVFSAWVVAPFALAYARAPNYAHSPAAGALLLVATAIALAFSVWGYWVTFVDNPKPDAQDGIVLFILPLYLLGGIGLAVGLAQMIAKWRR